MQLISLSGKKGCGKTTAAIYLEENHGFVRINFKDALVEEIKQNFPDLLREMSNHYGISIDELFLEKPTLVRTLMQNYGTDLRRKEDGNHWVKQWRVVANKFLSNGQNVVVDDVRFLNEAEAVRSLGGKIVKIERTGCDGDSHISETEMDSIEADDTIENNTDIMSLYNRLEEKL